MAADEPARAAKERRGAQPISALLENAIEPALRAKGFASSAIHMHWAEIVGPELARWSEPASLRWPPRPPGAVATKEGATLTIRVEGAFALDLQHRAPQVVDRINGYFGWRCVERLTFKQGPVRKPQPAPRRAKPELTVDASRRLDRLLEPVDSPTLKAALARLGVGVLGKR